MIMHIDMDAFFASVEQLDTPELRGKPVIVGSPTRRGVVTTASYEARRFGIHSAMPMFQARKLCPEAIIVPGRMSRYKEISSQVMDVLEVVSPLVEQVSIDEAYVDISGTGRIHGPPEDVAMFVKKAIFQRVQLTCSIGIAPLKFLAKIASDMEKPAGITIIQLSDVAAFIDALPVRKVPGVGKAARAAMRPYRIETLGDIKKISKKRLVDRLGKLGHRLVELAHGVDRSTVGGSRPTKSISAEKTLPENTLDMAWLKKCLLEQAERVGRQLREESFAAKTIVMKIKYADFKQISRSITLPKATRTSADIYRQAVRLLKAESLDQEVRLIGVGVSGLIPDTVPLQQELFGSGDEKDERWEQVDSAVDEITRKFGRGKVAKAAQFEDR